MTETVALKKCHSCKKCLSTDLFYKNIAKPDGFNSSCRTCHKEWRKSHYRRNSVRVTAQNRKWERDHIDVTRSWRRSATKRAYIAKLKPLGLHVIYGMVYRALRDGVILKSPCRICGEAKVEAHHEDYSKPLDLLWYCRRHHTRLHQIVGTRLDTYRELLAHPIPTPPP